MAYRRPDLLTPCGTAAAVRRHYRRAEPLDHACLQAMRRERAERIGTQAARYSPDHRPIRNGLPFRPYVYRGTGADAYTGEIVQ